MANEALKRFMIERLLDLDPTLSDDEGSEIFSKVVDPLLSRLGTDPKTVDIETFIVNRMSDEFPDLDVSSPGSVLRDVLVSPLVLLLEPIRREINFVRTQLSVADPTSLTTDELDALLSNIFSVRNIGEFSRGSVRVFFNSAQAVSVDQSIVFSTAGGISFVPEQVKTFLASELRRSGNLFYLDMPVRSVEADVEANVSKNAVRFVNGLEGVVRVTNRAGFSGGVSEETGEEFLERAERSLSERSLNTRRGLETSILNNFSDITSIEVVGYGEALMQRDILKGRATLSSDELLGPMIYTASDFRGEPIFSHTDTQGPPKDFLIPFTNTIRLINVPVSKQGLVKNAKYLRIIGGGEDFDSFLLSRVRTIGKVYEDPNTPTDLLVETTDFKVYPSPSTDSLPKKSLSSSIFTNEDEYGFNRFSKQGSAYSLIGTGDVDDDNNDEEVILGAPLPFTDYVDADSLIDKPTAAIPGADFLLVTKADQTNLTYYRGEVTDLNNEYNVPAKLRLFPISALYPDHKIGVDRIDSFLTSRDRINYQGEENFVYSPTSSTSGKAERINIIDFGGPALSQAAPANYDGISLEPWSRNAGVSLEGRNPGYQADLFDSAQTLDMTTLVAPNAEVKECDIVLNPNVPTWSARGVKEGHFVSLAVFDDNFVGELSAVNTDIRWQAWGRIKKIDPHGDGDFRRARVEGLDWVNVEATNISSFSAGGISGVFGIDNEYSPIWESLTPLTTNTPINTEYTFKLTYDTPILLDVPIDSTLVLSALMSDATRWRFKWTAGTTITAYDGQVPANNQGSVGTVNQYTGYLSIDLSTANIAIAVADNTSWQLDWFARPTDKYRAHWTVFEGERQMVASDGKLNISYDELVYPPAYKGTANASIEADGAVAAVSNLPYIGDNEDPALNNGFADIGDVAHNRAYSGAYQSTVAWWIRLDKNFFFKHNSLAASPSELCTSAEFHLLYDASLNPDPVDGTYDDDIQRDYPRDRFSQSTPILGDVLGQENNFKTVVSSPFVPGSIVVSNPTDATVGITAIATGTAYNQKGHSGFLIPYPFGPSFSQVAPYDDDAFLLSSTMVCLHDSVESIEEIITGITVSEIPGSVPFPNFFAGNLDIKDTEVHIGGLTDIYIKPTTSETQTSGVITLTPELLNNKTAVLLEAEDGSLVTNANDEQATHFVSVDLDSYISSTYGPDIVYLDDLVVQLIEPSPDLDPQFFRILHTAPGGVKIDGTFLGVDTLTNIRFRLMKTCATSLSEPLTLLQQGDDLKILANALSVDLTDGVDFSQDVTNVSTFLHIDEGDSFGEYLIISRSAESLGIFTPTPFSGEGLNYRIYTKQTSGISLPLVRIKSVGFAGDLEGITVPYKDPIDIIASSFTGLNDDPLTDITLLQEGVLATDVDGYATFTVQGVDLRAAGVLGYNVLRIDSLDEPLRYFYVASFATSGMATNDVLVLDRVISLVVPLTELAFTVGHPSVGTAELIFKDKTFIEVNQDTELSFTDTLGKVFKFRPSPAESAILFQSEVDLTSVTVGTTGPAGDTLLSTDENWTKYGLKEGDTIQILSKVISTGEFTAQEAESFNLSGSTLSIKVDATVHNVIFTGNNPLKLADISSDINRQLSGLLSTAVEAGTIDPDAFVLKFYSRNAVEILDIGSLGILSALKVSETSNISLGDLIGSFLVDSLTYDTATSTSSIILNSGTTALAVGAPVFIKVLRLAQQRLYPADLVQDSDGFHKGSIKLTSLDPLKEETIEAGQQLDITGHTSLGYECVVANNNYSYSMGEEISIKVTSVILPDFATSFNEAHPLPGAGVTITYDRSPEVESIQSFVLQPFVRVVCNNPLARHYFPAYPVFNLDYAGFSPVSEIRSAVETFFSTLYPNRPLEVYDLTAILSKRRVSFVSYPLEVAFLTYDKDRKMKLVRSTNIVVLDKTFHIMEDLDMVTINRVG